MQDTTNFLPVIDSLTAVNLNTLFYTIDVTSLYTCLRHDIWGKIMLNNVHAGLRLMIELSQILDLSQVPSYDYTYNS